MYRFPFMVHWDADERGLGHCVSPSLIAQWEGLKRYERDVLTTPNGLYSLPILSSERRPVDLKHEIFGEILKGHYMMPDLVRAALAPRNDGEPRAILDIGTGNGNWAISMAREFPHVEVVGIDLIPPVPIEKVPSNCRFVVDDVNQSLDHYANCFDVIHGRQIDSGIHDFELFLNQVARMLRPGGVLLLVKGVPQLYSPTNEPLPVLEEGDPGFTFLQKLFGSCHTAIANRGGAVNAAFQYEDRFAQEPNFVQIGTHRVNVPIGPWQTDLDASTRRCCELMRMLYMGLIHTMLPLLRGMSPEPAVKHWIAGAESELKSLSVRAYSKWCFAWAVRQSGPWIQRRQLQSQHA